MTEVKEKKTEEIKKEAEENIKCPVNKSLYYIREFLAGPMCSRCFPCMMGAYEAEIRLQNIVEGRGTEADLAALRMIVDNMLEASMCKKGKDTARFILEWMDTDVYKEHIQGKCLTKECNALTEFKIIPEKCIMCGLCLDACRYSAIIGEKKKRFQIGYLPFEIRMARCVRCGDCIKVCPTDAIVIVDVKEKTVQTVQTA
jgi:formate hydrogenlyase subunit 6/NADH:ubiquinone oxidoreductase subunit I